MGNVGSVGGGGAGFVVKIRDSDSSDVHTLAVYGVTGPVGR